MIGAASAQGSVFAATVIVARMLGPRTLGEFGMIQSTVGMFGVFAGMGLGLTATRYIAEFRSTQPRRAGRVTGLTLSAAAGCAVVVAGAVWIAAPILCRGPMNAAGLVPALRAGCVLLLFNSISGVQAGVLMGFESFRLLAWTGVIRGAVTLPLVYMGVRYGGVTGGVAALAAAAIVGVAAAQAVLHRAARANGVPIQYLHFQGELPLLWKLSIPAFLSGAVTYPVNWIVRAVVVQQPGGYYDLGLLTGALRIQDVIAYAGQTLGAALLPMLAYSRRSASANLVRANHLMPWGFGLAIALPLVAFPEALGLMLGREFAGTAARETVILVLLCTCLCMYKQGVARCVISGEYMWWGALSNSSTAAVVFAATWFLKDRGAPGLAAAYLLAHALNVVVFVPFYVRRGLAPRHLLMSRDSLALWVVTAAACLVALAAPGISTCAATAAAAGLVAAVLFARLWSRPFAACEQGSIETQTA